MLEVKTKKFKAFKIVCYLRINTIFDSLFPEMKRCINKAININTPCDFIAPIPFEMQREKMVYEQIQQEWAFILQEIAHTRCHIKAQFGMGKEFILYPTSLSNLLDNDKALKHKHDRTVGVFDCQIYDDQSEDCTDITGTVKYIACSLSDVLKCDTKLFFDEVEYGFVYEDK